MTTSQIIAEFCRESEHAFDTLDQSNGDALAISECDREIEAARRRRNDRLSELNERQDERGKG